ncbi:MAG: hypothetical protein LUD76_04780, partial [Alistipes sp.]|nr:hypothetical protein [Alistipes sp.]
MVASGSDVGRDNAVVDTPAGMAGVAAGTAVSGSGVVPAMTVIESNSTISADSADRSSSSNTPA